MLGMYIGIPLVIWTMYKHEKRQERKTMNKKILKALNTGNYLSIKDGYLKILSSQCVNSKWKADWMIKSNGEACQCGFKCKIRIQLSVNGHSPYTYIVDEKELYNLIK